MQPNTTIELDPDEALVFFDWIHRFNNSDDIEFEDQAEQRVLWDIEAILEKSLAAVMNPEYARKLAEARSKVRDRE